MTDEKPPKRTNGKRKPRRATQPATVAAATWRERAVELRTQGWTYARIAKECGVSIQSAYQAVVRYLEETRAVSREHAEEIRRLELDRLDRMLSAFGPRAEDGDAAAADRVLRIQERRAKLLGLDAPAETRSTIDAHPDTVRALMALVAPK